MSKINIQISQTDLPTLTITIICIMLSVLWNYFRIPLFGFCLRMVVLSRSQLRSFWNWLCVHVCIISVQLRKASNLRLNQWFQHPKTCLCDNCDNGIYADADEHVMIRIL